MKFVKTIIICQECQMPYYKAFWEPRWLVNLAAKEIHNEWHEMALNPETTPLAVAWREWERERIIKLLEDECSSDWPKVIEMPLGNLIALIREEQK